MKYLHKGDLVSVVGDLVLQSYVDTKGQERYSMQVSISDIEFLSTKRSTDEPQQSQAPQATSQPATAAAVTYEDEDSLPF